MWKGKGWESSDSWQQSADGGSWGASGDSWQQGKGNKDSWSQLPKGGKSGDDSWSQSSKGGKGSGKVSSPSAGDNDSWSQPQQKGWKDAKQDNWNQPRQTGNTGGYGDCWSQQKGGKGSDSWNQPQQKGDSWDQSQPQYQGGKGDNSWNQSQQKSDSWNQSQSQYKGGRGDSNAHETWGGVSQSAQTNSWNQGAQKAPDGWNQRNQSEQQWQNNKPSASSTWNAQQEEAPPSQLNVTACQHPHIGRIIMGFYTKDGENHGKPVYKKDVSENGLTPQVYFWDERDGPSQSGWWFGPVVGGEQVWAYHPEKASSPPKSGWQVPFGGAIDPMTVEDAWSSQEQSWDKQPQSAQKSWTHDRYDKGRQEEEERARQEKKRQEEEAEDLRRRQQQEQEREQHRRRQQQEQEAERLRQEAERLRQEEAMRRQQEEEYRRRQQQEQEAHREYRRIQQQEHEALMRQKQMEEMERRRAQEQIQNEQERRRKMEEYQQQREAALQRKQELEAERAQKLEIAEKLKKEQFHVFAIRRTAMKVRLATSANFEALEKELEVEITKNLDNCGEQALTVKKECEDVLESARARFAKAREEQNAALAKKEEEDRLNKVKKEKAEALVKEFETQVAATEIELEKLKEIFNGLDFSDDEKTSTDIETLWKKVDEGKDAYKACTKICTDVLKEQGAAVKEAIVAVEVKREMQLLMKRLSECQKAVDASMTEALGRKEKALKGAAAREKTKALEDVFKLYDQDGDGFLSQKEVSDFAKGELEVKLDEASLNYIWDCLVDDDAKGVVVDKLALVRSVIGVSKELLRNAKRREFRLQKEAVIGGMKDELKAKVRQGEKLVRQIEEALRRAEKCILQIGKKARIMSPDEIITMANESEDLLATAKQSHDNARGFLSKISEGVEPKYEDELRRYVHDESKQIETILSLSEHRIDRVRMLARRHRGQAKENELNAIEQTKNKALKMIQFRKAAEKLSQDELFALIDVDGDGKLSEQEFVTFFNTAKVDDQPKDVLLQADDANAVAKADAETEPPGLATPEASLKGADEEKKQDGEEKKAEGEGKNIGDGSKDAIIKRQLEKVEFSETELSALFTYLDEEKTGFLSKELFSYFARYYLKVAQGAPLCSTLEVSGSSVIRKLELQEIVEVIEGPLEDAGTKLKRMSVRAVKDGLEGWITVASNLGKALVTEGGSLFKVVQTTALTDEFEVNGEADDSRKLYKHTVLEARGDPKKEETSGCTRMKCRVRSKEGRVGWVTMQSKEGVSLIKML